MAQLGSALRKKRFGILRLVAVAHDIDNIAVVPLKAQAAGVSDQMVSFESNLQIGWLELNCDEEEQIANEYYK